MAPHRLAPATPGLRACWLALGLAAAAPAALAADDEPVFRLNGFGTASLVHSSERNADYTTGFTPTGAGFSKSWSPAIDSRVGVQASANFGEHLSAVLQLVSEQQWDKRWVPQVEWANVRYAFSPDLDVRVGRTAIPLLLFSDNKVGYAIAPVRPSSVWYATMPLSHSDGVDASWRTRFGDVTNTVMGYVGTREVTLPDGSPDGLVFKSRLHYLLVDKVEMGDLTLQASYFDVPHLITAKLRAVPVPFIARLADSPYRRTFAGFSYNPGHFFVTGEIGRDWSQLVGDRTGGILTAGYRIGAFTPFARLEKAKVRRVSPLFTDSSADAAAAGVRWDVAKSMDLKLQVDRIRPKATPLVSAPIGPLANIQPGFRTGKPFTVISVAADFVF